MDVFFSLERELEFELKISVLGQKVEFYSTKYVGDLDWTSHWQWKQLTSLNRSVINKDNFGEPWIILDNIVQLRITMDNS